MSDVSILLQSIESGDKQAAAKLLPLVYEELRRLAAHELQSERPGHTLQPTALVHEAFVRLVGKEDDHKWNHRGHFYGAAARAMRQILVESARRKKALKRGGVAANGFRCAMNCSSSQKVTRIYWSSTQLSTDWPKSGLTWLTLFRLGSLPALRWSNAPLYLAFPNGEPNGTGPMQKPGCYRRSNQETGDGHPLVRMCRLPRTELTFYRKSDLRLSSRRRWRRLSRFRVLRSRRRVANGCLDLALVSLTHSFSETQSLRPKCPEQKTPCSLLAAS